MSGMPGSSEIRTERLLITPFTEKHISERYLGWLNDRELMRYSEQRHRLHTRVSALAYLRSFADSPHCFWAIEERREGLGHIGNLNAYVDVPNGVADVGILIGESRARQKGYGLEGWLAVCRFLLTTLGMRKISAGAMAANIPMLKLMRAAGMREDGVRRGHYFLEGREMDIINMALFRNEPVPESYRFNSVDRRED